MEYKEFYCNNGKTYKFPKKHYVFCKHCTDLFFDCNGPYGFICSLGLKDCENCNKFEEESPKKDNCILDIIEKAKQDVEIRKLFENSNPYASIILMLLLLGSEEEMQKDLKFLQKRIKEIIDEREVKK